MKDFKEKIVDNVELLNIVNEKKTIMKEDRYNNDSIKALWKGYPEKNEKLEETFIIYMGENDLKILKTEFRDKKWKYLTKIRHIHMNSSTAWWLSKSVDNLKKKDFSKSKSKCLDDEEIERTREIFEIFNFKNWEEFTEPYLKKDVLLLACDFEKFIEVSVWKFEFNPLYCDSLPGFTWKCGLNYTGINLQTLQDKHLILTLKNNIRGGVSSVMGEKYVKSGESKQILYIDATNLNRHSTSQVLPYDEIEMRHGHFDLHMKKLEELLNIRDDSVIGNFVEVELRYTDKIKQKTKNFPYCPDNKKINPDDYNN